MNAWRVVGRLVSWLLGAIGMVTVLGVMFVLFGTAQLNKEC